MDRIKHEGSKVTKCNSFHCTDWELGRDRKKTFEE
jgi:hypothetical protein